MQTNGVNAESRNKPTHPLSTDFQQRCQDRSLETEQSLQQMAVGQVDIHIKERIWILTSYHIQKKKGSKPQFKN